MSGHSYMPQLENRFGARYYEQPWRTTNNDEETYSNRWGNTGFPSNGHDTHRQHDHPSKPVLVDADGRKSPLVAYNPGGKNNMDNCVTKTEIIEQVYSPHQGNRYANHSPPKIGGIRQDYGRQDSEPNRPEKASTDNYVTTTEIIEHVYAPHQGTRYGNHSPPKIGKDSGAHNNKWNKPGSPTYDHHKPAKGDEFVSQVQAKTSEPTTSALVRNMYNWRLTPNSNGHSNTGNHGRHQGPSHFDVYSKQEPTMITEGGWHRPSRTGWADDKVLMKPTNDIGAAIDYLTDVHGTQPSVTTSPTHQRRFTIPTALIKTAEATYSTPVDHSRVPLRRYGGLVPPHAVTTTEVYMPTLDSRDAARKYHGQMM